MTELFRRSAADLACMIRAREISARELLDSCLARIDAVNPDLNAIVTLVPEIAHERAVAADQAIADGDALGPLHGLPVAHKDLELTAGIRTTMGSPLFAEFVPEEDGLIAQRMRAAGAVVVGKTNTPEFGAGSHTFNEVFGRTMNPYDLSRTCGGSSGGAAVALAADMIPIADGSDMGGSLRNPAAFCNVVGLRPSYGRVPSWPNRTPWSGLGTSGVLARTVDDLALQMQAVAGPDVRVPISLPEPGSVFATLDDVDPSGLRVAWTPDLGLPIEAEVRDALTFVPGHLASLGCRVEETMPDLHDAREIFQTLRAWHFEISTGDLYDTDYDRIKDTVRWNVEEARRRMMHEHGRATVAHAALIERVRSFFDHHDVLALPTTQVAPFDIALDWPRTVDGVEMESYIDWMRVCSDITVTGCPAISMPAAFTPDGLPVGVQFVGRPRGDVELLSFARLWERSVRPTRTTVVDS
ncbi:amidase [Ilumatobacter sp.]|uniref:amidase n=1 Tax=Ilumatobacter sp. TaxID=1967498 RepID=UPI003AF83F0E